MSRSNHRIPGTLASAIAGVAAINAGLFAQTPPDKGPEPVQPAPVVITPSSAYTTPVGESKATILSEKLPEGSYQTLNHGFRRVHRSETLTLTAEQVAEYVAAGKGDQLNGNTITVQTFRDYLPENWMTSVDGLPAGMQVDSYGNPIVNEAYALPGWAQQDVEALRAEIGNWLVHLDNLDLALAGNAAAITTVPPRASMAGYLRDAQNLETDRLESQHILGNYLAQTFTRNIDVSDVLPLSHPRITPIVADAMARHFHYYESLKSYHAQRRNESWPRGAYPQALVALLAAHGHVMSEILTLPEGDEGGIAGAGDCYNRFTFAPGWAATVNGIGIWHGVNAPADDLSVDIPIGFPCYYQPCEDGNPNLQVRVASNGYIGFFEQGAGQTPGTIFNNTVLPSTIDPDGIAAPHWDDLLIANQGTVDEVVYKIEGAFGNRVLTVEYWSVSHFSGVTTEFYYFQVKLWESLPDVQFQYDIFSPDPAVDSRTVGVENYSGNGATCGPSCGNTITGPPPSNYAFFIPPPSNDGCAGAVCIEPGQTIAGDNFGAGGTDITSCTTGDLFDVWYRLRSPVTGNVTLNTCALAWLDTSLAVFSSCGGAQLACNDDSCGLQSSVTFAATAGTEYRVRVAGWNGTRGLFQLTMVTAGSPGSTCATCTALAGPSNTVLGSTADNGTCTPGEDWFCWTAPAGGTYRATTCNGGTNFDTVLEVYQGANCAALNLLAFNDDGGDESCDLPPGGANFESRVVWVADAGVAYKVKLRGFGGAIGSYQFNLVPENCPADVAPAHNGDRVVNIDDLLTVISAWGPCSNCRADFVPPGGNNQVNIDDLLAVISAWGACPP